MRRRPTGFSLIEVMIVVLIAGILIAAAIPMFTVWIQNSQIRTAGESLVNGLQSARNEAIRRNAYVLPLKVIDKPRTAWEVKLCAASEDADPALITRAHEEGSENATVVVTPPEASIVSFNALGRVVNPNPSDGSVPMTRVDVGNPTLAAASERKLRIEVPAGGAMRMCDPSSTVAAGDPRKCA